MLQERLDRVLDFVQVGRGGDLDGDAGPVVRKVDARKVRFLLGDRGATCPAPTGQEGWS